MSVLSLFLVRSNFGRMHSKSVNAVARSAPNARLHSAANCAVMAKIPKNCLLIANQTSKRLILMGDVPGLLLGSTNELLLCGNPPTNYGADHWRERSGAHLAINEHNVVQTLYGHQLVRLELESFHHLRVGRGDTPPA